MRKISIITLVSLFFALTIAVINLALGLEYKRQKSDLSYFAFQRFITSVKLMQELPQERANEQLEALHVKLSHADKALIAQQGEKLLEDPFFDMMLHENTLYFVPKSMPHPPPMPHDLAQDAPPPHEMMMPHPPPPPMPLLEDTGEFSLYRVWILAIVINVLVLLFFGVVMQKLLRLRHLKSGIRAFGENPNFKMITVDSEDELGEIATEFNQAMEKIHHLKEARTLFLHNILHELKTPIMKGQILSQSLENELKKAQLERIFARLEGLLGEMVKVEKLSSNEWKLEAKEYRLVDVLDHAKDLLMSETRRLHVNLYEQTPLVLVDFELFATALKNLIDNALKHSKEMVEVRLDKKSVSVLSVGEPLDEKRLDFTKAFNRSIEGASQGLGLGLYIANAIFAKHGFRLTYTYEDGQNCFRVWFK